MSQNFVVLSVSLRIVFLTAKAQRKCKRIMKVVVDVSKLRSSVGVSAVNFLPRGIGEMKTARRSEPFKYSLFRTISK